MTFFTPKFSIYPPKFLNDLFITAQTAFHNCTFQTITAHFVHHCALKQARHPLRGILLYLDNHFDKFDTTVHCTFVNELMPCLSSNGAS